MHLIFTLSLSSLVLYQLHHSIFFASSLNLLLPFFFFNFPHNILILSLVVCLCIVYSVAIAATK